MQCTKIDIQMTSNARHSTASATTQMGSGVEIYHRQDHIGFGGPDKTRWLGRYVPWSLKNGGYCSTQRRAGATPRKGTARAKVRAGQGPLQRQDAIPCGRERRTRAWWHTDTRKGRVHSLARNGAGTSLNEGTQGSGHGEESWKGHCGTGPRGRLRGGAVTPLRS